MPELQEKLKVLQKTRLYSNISTNLAVLKSRDFTQLQPEILTNNVTASDLEEPSKEPDTEGMSARSPSKYAFFGVLTLLLFGFGAWRFIRK